MQLQRLISPLHRAALPEWDASVSRVEEWVVHLVYMFCVVVRILAGQIFYFLKRTQITSELLLWCRGKEMLLNTKQMHSNKAWCGEKF